MYVYVCAWVRICTCMQILKIIGNGWGAMQKESIFEWIKRHLPLYLYMPPWIILWCTKMLPFLYLCTRTLLIVDRKFIEGISSHSPFLCCFLAASTHSPMFFLSRTIEAAAASLSEVKSEMKTICSPKTKFSHKKYGEDSWTWTMRKAYHRVKKEITLTKWKDCIIENSL